MPPLTCASGTNNPSSNMTFPHRCLQTTRPPFQILLISGTGNKSKWVVPGGGLEPSEEVVEAAHREVLEEAGVSGIVSRTLGVFQVVLKLNIVNYYSNTTNTNN